MTVVPDSIVFCSENTNKLTKTQYSIQVCLDRVDLGDTTLPEAERDFSYVGYHPSLAEKLAKDYLNSPVFRGIAAKNLLAQPPATSTTDYTYTDHLTLANSMQCAGQVSIGDSRVDFILSSAPAGASPSILVEVKNAVCAEYAGSIEKAENKVRFGVYTGPEGLGGPGYVSVSKRVGLESLASSHGVPLKCAIFPSGKKKPGTGVVSSRAIKHIQNLITLCSDSNMYKGVLIFVVNRSDCDAFRPCHEACLLFSQMLYRASLCHNIDIMALEVVYEAASVADDGSISQLDSQRVCAAHLDRPVSFVAKLTRELPVLVAKVVIDTPIDEANLRKVLEAAEQA